MNDKPIMHQTGKEARCAASREQIITEWRRDLKRFQNEIWTLLNSRAIYKRIREIVNANPRIQNGNVVYDLLRRSHAVCSSMAIRRLLDEDERNRPVSFCSLVRSIEKNKHVITREWFLSQCEEIPENCATSEDYGYLFDANRDFDALVGDGRDTINSEDLQRRLDLTKSLSKPVTDYADKLVAHTDRKGLDEPLTYTQVDEAIDAVNAFFLHLDAILNQTSLNLRIPLVNDSWDKLLEEPWIRQNGETAE